MESYNKNVSAQVIAGSGGIASDFKKQRRKKRGKRQRKAQKKPQKLNDGVRALSSHQCGLGSNPGVDVVHALRLLITLLCSARLIFLQPSPFLEKKKSKFQFDQKWYVDKEALFWMCYLKIVKLLIRFLNYKRFHLCF